MANLIRMQKYPRGSRGSPAKGVVLDNGSAGSNPAFCAIVAAKRRFEAVAFWQPLSFCRLPLLFPKNLSSKSFSGTLRRTFVRPLS